MPTTKSPLRYPGGKTQLASYVQHLIELNNCSETYIETFAGGSGVTLYLLENNLVKQAVINDYDKSIFSVWFFILNYPSELINRITNTNISIEEWHHQKEIHELFKDDPFSINNAFSTLFLNRTNVSGVINGGPMGGKNQTGKYKINCRFLKDKLIQKIETITKLNNRIRLSRLDAKKFISNELGHYNPTNTFIFFDPPYFKQGKNLYLSFCSNKEHASLAKAILKLEGYRWITTYDQAPEILNLYKDNSQSFEYSLNYSANKKRVAKEYLFASPVTKLESFGKIELKQI
ncbi:DNA adenine methylase [Liquorilactobacillus nagelii]|uniref:DNA adenine methylase n=1 Tax=Liquorilactobacillus nagelii TaxID=82688 RepID=UPI0006EEE8CA|nr:DNA adenine methylase [Liquorilactobacillus nagelii]KRL40747.1 DNA methyltransferase [Liquorilactobacillus nagelii DSM 13675]QYH53711.1 DNA adenine methylase [Liquorilactobacillus nagelii DSM 13675]